MIRAPNSNGWTLDQGLAAQYAAQAGLDPDLAADAGEEVWDVLKSLRDATSETDPQRQAKLMRRTKARLAKVLLSKAGLSRHGELVQHIEAKLLALQGRGGDTELAHLTPGEMIVPAQLQTPEVVYALQQAAQNAGIDLRRYTAGSDVSSVNPDTGLEEYRFECVEGRNGPCGNIADPINTMTHRFIYNGVGRLSANQPGITSTHPGQFTGTVWQTGTGRFPGSGGGGVGSYYPDHTNYTGTGITGAETGGSGGGDSIGGAPYGSQPEEKDPIEEIVVTAPDRKKPRSPWDTIDPIQLVTADPMSRGLGHIMLMHCIGAPDFEQCIKRGPVTPINPSDAEIATLTLTELNYRIEAIEGLLAGFETAGKVATPLPGWLKWIISQPISALKAERNQYIDACQRLPGCAR